MKAAPKVPANSNRSQDKPGATYRGVSLQAIGGQSRFSRNQIKEAVETAIAKNRDELAHEG